MRSKRQKEIKNLLSKYESITYDELCKHFDVSLSTMRRDIDELVKGNEVIKSYGGVSLNRESIDSDLMSFDISKDLIAKRASTLIKDGDVILMGSGSTVAHMAPYLKDRKITVITNNLIVLMSARKYGLKVISIGGTLDYSTESFVGTQTIKQVSELNADYAFLGCNGINLERISNVHDMEAEVKKAMIKSSAKTVVLIDSTKFGKTSLYSCAELKELDYVVSDKTPSKEYLDVFNKNNIELIKGE